VVAAHQVVWTAALSDALLVAFLILYARHSPFAWLVIPTFGAMGLVQSPFIFFSSPPHYPLRVRIFTFVFVVAFSLAVTAYGSLVRCRYETYLRDRCEAAPNI